MIGTRLGTRELRVAAYLVRFLAVLFFVSQAIQAQSPLLTMPERKALARPLLLHAESIAARSNPATRAILLYHTAGAWVNLDRAKEVALYKKAFAAARQIEPAQARSIEYDILSDLLPLAPSATLHLIPKAEHERQDGLYREEIDYTLCHNDVARAIRIFDQAADAGIVAEPSAASILMAIPQTNTAERVHVFNTAMATYKTHALTDSIDQWGIWNASSLIAYYWQSLPAPAVLRGIDIVLDRAAERDKLQPIAGNIGSLSYKKRVDMELFAVIPALKKLAPARAGVLLTEHPAVVEFLGRFPEGLPSVFPHGLFGNDGAIKSCSQSTGTSTATYATAQGAHAANLTSADMGLEFTIPLNLKEVRVKSEVWPPRAVPDLFGSPSTCPPAHILASVGMLDLRNLPPCGESCLYSQADSLNIVAERCTYDPRKAEALSALAGLVELLPQMPADKQIDYLANAADLYLRLGERPAAASTVKTGFELAATLLSQDKASPRLQSVRKAVWPSTEVYRRMISLGVNADFEQTSAAVEAIPDADLGEIERVMLARALLGVPADRYRPVIGMAGFGSA